MRVRRGCPRRTSMQLPQCDNRFLTGFKVVMRIGGRVRPSRSMPLSSLLGGPTVPRGGVITSGVNMRSRAGRSARSRPRDGGEERTAVLEPSGGAHGLFNVIDNVVFVGLWRPRLTYSAQILREKTAARSEPQKVLRFILSVSSTMLSFRTYALSGFGGTVEHDLGG